MLSDDPSSDLNMKCDSETFRVHIHFLCSGELADGGQDLDILPFYLAQCGEVSAERIDKSQLVRSDHCEIQLQNIQTEQREEVNKMGNRIFRNPKIVLRVRKNSKN